MTIKELYEWAVENKVENCEFEIRNRDEDGYMNWRTFYLNKDDIKIEQLQYNQKTVVVL